MKKTCRLDFTVDVFRYNTKQKDGLFMGKVVSINVNQNNINDPNEFYRLSDEQQKSMVEWIQKHIEPYRIKTYSDYHSSYQLKHLFASHGGFYVSNGAMKGAMLQCGFKPQDFQRINWLYQISKKLDKQFMI